MLLAQTDVEVRETIKVLSLALGATIELLSEVV